MLVVPLSPEHLQGLVLQSEHAYLQSHLSPSAAEALARSGGFAMVVAQGTVAVAGVHTIWDGRGVAWAFLSRDAGPYMIAIHRAVKRFLDLCPLDRIEASVNAGFSEGHRWLRMLGFQCETPLARKFNPVFAPQRDAALYARVRA